MCFDFLYKFRLKHLSLEEGASDIWSKCVSVFMWSTLTLFLSDCNENLNFLTDLRKILKYKIGRKFKFLNRFAENTQI
jgi:hypothetical protein